MTEMCRQTSDSAVLVARTVKLAEDCERYAEEGERGDWDGIADLLRVLSATLTAQAEELAKLHTEWDEEAKAQQESYETLMRHEEALGEELARLKAERDVLRGVGCLEDGDGPCGVCVKCLRLGKEAAEAEVSRLQ